MWNEDNIKYLIDPKIFDPKFEAEILRCIYIRLLCIQEHVRDKPTMATMVSMIKSEIVNLPTLNQVAFILKQVVLVEDSP